MSAQDLKKFEDLVKNDDALRNQLAGLQGRGSASDQVAQIAQGRGLSISASEVDEYLKSALGGGELSDDALSRVAGGGWTYIG